MSKRVKLVYPYLREKDPVEKLFQPLGIAYLASQLRHLGIEADVCDCTFESLQGSIELISSG